MISKSWFEFKWRAGDAKQCPDKEKETTLYEKTESCDNEKCESKSHLQLLDAKIDPH